MRSTWRPGDEIVYLSPDSSGRLVEGRLPKVVPGRRLVLKCRWLGDPELEADGPDREMFEIEEMDEICKLTAMFDRIEPGSPAYGRCDMSVRHERRHERCDMIMTRAMQMHSPTNHVRTGLPRTAAQRLGSRALIGRDELTSSDDVAFDA